MATSHSRGVRISVSEGDVLTFAADVLVLKYAQKLYGADDAVYEVLTQHGIKVPLPEQAEWTVVQSGGVIASSQVVFVGVKPLYEFEYPDIRQFAYMAVEIAASLPNPCRSLAITLHGAGYGLDAVEAFDSEIRGLFDGISSFASAPLEQITIVERDAARADVLQARLRQLLPDEPLGRIARETKKPGSKRQAQDRIPAAIGEVSEKPRIFVAMPFRKETANGIAGTAIG